MERIAYSFNCGLVNITARGEVNLDVHKWSDIYDVIIPFLDKYAVYGIKSFDFKDWKTVAEFIKKKALKKE